MESSTNCWLLNWITLAYKPLYNQWHSWLKLFIFLKKNHSVGLLFCWLEWRPPTILITIRLRRNLTKPKCFHLGIETNKAYAQYFFFAECWELGHWLRFTNQFWINVFFIVGAVIIVVISAAFIFFLTLFIFELVHFKFGDMLIYLKSFA